MVAMSTTSGYSVLSPTIQQNSQQSAINNNVTQNKSDGTTRSDVDKKSYKDVNIDDDNDKLFEDSPETFATLLALAKEPAINVNENNNSNSATSATDASSHRSDYKWYDTSMILAPTKNGCGWGVFATRAFTAGEIVYVSPLMLRFEAEPQVLKQTLLDNYHYEYHHNDGNKETMLAFGYTLCFNHHSTDSNLQYTAWGMEPTVEDLNTAVAVGYTASRDIDIGEELVTDYGGSEWFQDRGIILRDFDIQQQKQEIWASCAAVSHERRIPEWLHPYESKLFTGFGSSATWDKIIYAQERREACHITDHNAIISDMKLYHSQLPSYDAAYHNVRIKLPSDNTNDNDGIIPAGTILEIAPAMVLQKSHVTNTLLEALSFTWEQITKFASIHEGPDNHGSTQDRNNIKLLYLAPDTNWQRVQKSYHVESETMILPLAASIGLLSRTTNLNDANCRLEWAWEDDCYDSLNENDGESQMIRLWVIATKPLKREDVACVYCSSNNDNNNNNGFGSRTRNDGNDPCQNLLQELIETGQPIPQDMFGLTVTDENE